MSAAGSPKAAQKTLVEEPTQEPEVELVIPDVIERLPKPDKAAHDAECNKIDAEIKKLQARTVRSTLWVCPCNCCCSGGCKCRGNMCMWISLGCD